MALAAAAAIAGSATALADDENEGPAQAVAQLYELQAAFHEAAGGAGVDVTTKAQHLQEMLELFTADAVLVVGSTVYVGRGEANTSTCAPGTLTICDFFQNHAGSFVLGRNWAALTTLSRTHFEVHGKLADVYFECHYIDVATGVKMSDVSYGLLGQPSTGQARKVRGKWLLSFAEVGSPALTGY
ncbi:MAG TPA: hypothetical protein VGL55_11665 [Steroidobacteraceae bacterium]|jgi:hypothetical protein